MYHRLQESSKTVWLAIIEEQRTRTGDLTNTGPKRVVAYLSRTPSERVHPVRRRSAIAQRTASSLPSTTRLHHAAPCRATHDARDNGGIGPCSSTLPTSKVHKAPSTSPVEPPVPVCRLSSPCPDNTSAQTRLPPILPIVVRTATKGAEGGGALYAEASPCSPEPHTSAPTTGHRHGFTRTLAPAAQAKGVASGHHQHQSRPSPIHASGRVSLRVCDALTRTLTRALASPRVTTRARRTHARCCNQAPRPRTNEPFPSTQPSCLALLRAPPSSEKLARPPCRSEHEPAANHASTDDQPSASLSYTTLPHASARTWSAATSI